MNSACLLRTNELRQHDMDRALQALMELPKDRGYRLEWEEIKSQRTLQQNAYLFGVAYAKLAEVTGYEKEDLHEYLLGKHFGTKLKRIPKTKHNPEGIEEVPVRTTTTDERGRRSVLGRTAFGEYVDFVQRFAARHGINIPDPDPLWREQAEAA